MKSIVFDCANPEVKTFDVVNAYADNIGVVTAGPWKTTLGDSRVIVTFGSGVKISFDNVLWPESLCIGGYCTVRVKSLGKRGGSRWLPVAIVRNIDEDGVTVSVLAKIPIM